MGLSAPVPPEIIHKILDEIYDDPTSLKICSLAARSFYEPTRRYLFAHVTLDHAGTPSLLNRILRRNPRLSEYIQNMAIPDLEDPALRKIVPVLPALSRIRRLILGGRFSLYTRLSLTLEASKVLSVILQLPHLNTLEISLVQGFPISLLHIPRGLKYLILHNISLSTTFHKLTTQPLLELVSLHLDWVWSRGAWGGVLSLNAPNLCQVVVADSGSDILRLIQAGAESIEVAIWDNYTQGKVIDFRKLTHLRHFCIITSGGHVDQSRSHDPIHAILHTRTVAERLEQFTFVIRKPQDDPDSASTLWFLVLGSIWSSLADRSQFPRLRQVAVHLVDDRLNQPALSAEEFHSVVSQRLVPLAEAGLLHTVVCQQWGWNDIL